MSDPRIRVAVLGGGVGAMTTAFYLTSTPALRARYDVTVYQMGWRLGGKGASGRNRQAADRIEEHGLHIWMGFYENAFQAMRAAYSEADRPASMPIRTIEQAFKPHSYIVLEERLGPDQPWFPWSFDFPAGGDMPGLGQELPSVIEHAELLAKWLMAFWVRNPLAQQLEASASDAFEALPDWLEVSLAAAWSEGRDTINVFFASLGFTTRAQSRVAGLLERLVRLISALPDRPDQHGAGAHQLIVALIRAMMRLVWDLLKRRVNDDPEAYQLWVVVNLAGSALCGILADGIAFQGWDSIDDLELREWLGQHGANRLTLDSAPLRGVYDLVFGYVDGDIMQPKFAAGTAMRGMLRMLFSYRGAIFYKMQAGMGDVVFAPFYEVLKKRGVAFKFFHKVTSLELTPSKNSVARIRGIKQVELRDESREYTPLYTTPDGMPCWPSEPLYEQIKDGAALAASGVNLESSWSKPWQDETPFELVAGDHFDTIVLGIAVGAFPYVCRELIEANSRFRRMTEKVLTVNTLAFQLWLKPSLDQLGWRRPSGVSERPVVGAFVEPIDTWADMGQLLPREFWPAGHEPHSLAYFCGPYAGKWPIPGFDQHSYPEEELARVRAMTVQFLDRDVRSLWPATVSQSGGFSWDDLVDPSGASGQARLDSQYLRVNVEPTERYVLSVPKSTFYRLKPGDSGFTNVVLAGDWTYNAVNAGCVEAAVTSGMAASRHICGVPRKIMGEFVR